MELAKIEKASRRRRVAYAVGAGYSAEEIAEIHELEVADVIEDIAWLAERRKERLSEDRNVSDEVADEIMRIEDDEMMIRRWVGMTENLSVRIKLMDRLQKLRELRLKLHGAFDRGPKSKGTNKIMVLNFDGTLTEAKEVIEVEATEQPALESG